MTIALVAIKSDGISTCIKLAGFSLFLLTIVDQSKKHYFKIPTVSLIECLISNSVKWMFVFFILATLLTLAFDPLLLESIQNLHGALFEKVILFGGWLGRDANLYFVFLILYLLSVVTSRPSVCVRIFGCLLSMSSATFLCAVLKHVFLRARPYSNLGHLSFFNSHGLTENIFHSFPSGDTVIVAAVAFYLFLYLKKSYSRGILIFLPVSTALSRIALNKHWPSDTIFAIGLGLIVALVVFNYEKNP